jgi:hypothetical protein
VFAATSQSVCAHSAKVLAAVVLNELRISTLPDRFVKHKPEELPSLVVSSSSRVFINARVEFEASQLCCIMNDAI